MIVVPAVDLRDGRCVQLVGGSYDREVVSLDDPLETARRWYEKGFTSLHVVDLDAATGKGDNSSVVANILKTGCPDVQVGGGIRTSDRVAEVLLAGASRVVVGTRAVEDKNWIASIAGRHPGRIVAALDVRDREVVTRGWKHRSGCAIDVAIDSLKDLPLAAVLVTAVNNEGLMHGPDVSLTRDVVSQCPFPVHASGGIATMADLQALSEAGAAAAIVGMALYTGALSPADIIKEFVA